MCKWKKEARAVKKVLPPPPPLSKIRRQNRSLPRVQPHKAVPTLILSLVKVSLGLFQKVFFLLQSAGTGFVNFFFYKQFLQMSSLCWNDADGDTTCLLLLMQYFFLIMIFRSDYHAHNGQN